MLEYEERLEKTFAARTQADLAGILEDLPTVSTPASISRRRGIAKSMIVGWLTFALFFVGIWAMSDLGGYFWPIWPIMGTGLCTIPTAYAIWNGTSDPDED